MNVNPPRAAGPVPPPAESFQPRAHWAPDTPLRRLLFRLRMTVDLQTLTVHRDLRRELAGFTGRLLDVGCGNSPFRPLLDPQRTEYRGVDVETAASFGYHNPDVQYYDGRTLPFPDGHFDAVLSTEVLEHVPEPAPFVAEIHRVLKPGGLALLTVPWSARFHYQPHDYFRYTPSTLRALTAAFASVTVRPRGTDFSAIASKVVVAYVRNLLALLRPRAAHLWQLPFRLAGAVLGLPFVPSALVLGYAGIFFGLGSDDDPLGYTVVLRK